MRSSPRVAGKPSVALADREQVSHLCRGALVPCTHRRRCDRCVPVGATRFGSVADGLPASKRWNDRTRVGRGGVKPRLKLPGGGLWTYPIAHGGYPCRFIAAAG